MSQSVSLHDYTFFVCGFTVDSYTVAMNIDGDPETLHFYNHKTFDTKRDAQKAADKMSDACQDGHVPNMQYWDFGL